ncbi:threonine-phosphate decarboxylase CobD [Neobacillus niacini]|uniref:threonine-phosphate decarboxylase CobD n=1 Tax=Neobacillus niacini TaxID=86668 RepID=UPI0028581267|nr:threonine-phosphate decarboxylase CobD [Neobacillus niacini]MDR7001825.1 threonine-phosphate decarboxylase [Neobacillus niacini]
MNWPAHGSNPRYLYEAMGLTLPKEYVDYSANINPLGPPPSLKEKWMDFYQEIHVYPDPFASGLKERIAKKEQIPVESILIGNGGAELIALAARKFSGKKIVIIQPAFSEYEKNCRVNQCEIVYHQLHGPEFELDLADLQSSLIGATALFICNPNNPTGIQYPASTILSIMDECEQQNCSVILDEAFYDFLVDYHSFLPYINQYSNLIIIRSMTKMFAIPGIRLGYLVAEPSVIQDLTELQSHWSTNAIALLAGELCLQEEGFLKETQNYIFQERKRLFNFFQNQNFMVTPSDVNFYLMRDPYLKDQMELFEFLLHNGLIPRHTFNFPGLEGSWLRFAIKGSEENDRLLEVLVKWRQLHPLSL